MNYYISDLHLFHNNAIGFDKRPFESMNEMMDVIKVNWNGRVRDRDKVYIVGDVAMHAPKNELNEYVARLKGEKILIKGNHDRVTDDEYRQLFSEICDYKEIVDKAGDESCRLVLMHYPVFSFNKMRRGAVLLYGHTHNSAEDAFYQKCLAEMNENECSYEGAGIIRAFNVGCMKKYMDYTPRTLAEIFAANAANDANEANNG